MVVTHDSLVYLALLFANVGWLGRGSVLEEPCLHGPFGPDVLYPEFGVFGIEKGEERVGLEISASILFSFRRRRAYMLIENIPSIRPDKELHIPEPLQAQELFRQGIHSSQVEMLSGPGIRHV